LLSACLIAHSDQERRHVFAVVAGLLKGWTTTFRRDAITAELNGRQIGIGVRTLDAGGGVGLVDLEVSNDLALLVIEAAQEGPRTEQASKASIGKGRQSTSN